MAKRYRGETHITCKVCGKYLPIEHFYLTKGMRIKEGEIVMVDTMCKVCTWHRRKINELARFQRKKQEEEKAKPIKVRIPTCKEDCTWYPCFQGIDSMSCNLALTCLKFKNKEVANP